ncbi:MAG: hypothetical protein IJ583_16240 [Firmicutes bacterium]|nr:hypothetical protein [Bacillota bacterium]
MIKKAAACFLSVIIAMGAFVGCDEKVQKNVSYNLNIKQQEPKFEGIDIYYDISSDMKACADDENFEKIVYSAYSVSNDMIATTDKKCSVFMVGSDITEETGKSFSDIIKDKEVYLADNFHVLEKTLTDMKPKNLSVIVTDINYQLDNYSELGNKMMEKVLDEENELAMGVIGVNTKSTPFFIFIIGDNLSLSEFIEEFKAKPDIKAYSEKDSIDSKFQLDITRNINYEIFAKHNGVEGIDYKDVKLVENGIIYDTNGMSEFDKENSAEVKTIQAEGGSFTEINTDAISKEYLDTIEGTVNYSDVSLKKPVFDEEAVEKTQDGEEVESLTYIAAKSLIPSDEGSLLGKIKMEIPFKVIDGVMLSSLDCDVSAKLYTTNGEKFKEYDGKCEDFFEMKMSEGAIPEQGKWRVNDENDSVIFNIYSKNLDSWPKTSDFLKLDITFKHLASESLPAWVNEWNDTRVKNLSNFFDTMHKQQVKFNSSENMLTLYIVSADAKEK